MLTTAENPLNNIWTNYFCALSMQIQLAQIKKTEVAVNFDKTIQEYIKEQIHENYWWEENNDIIFSKKPYEILLQKENKLQSIQENIDELKNKTNPSELKKSLENLLKNYFDTSNLDHRQFTDEEKKHFTQ